MKKTAIILTCLFIVTAVLCFQAVAADKQQFCKNYADTAVKQYNLGKQHNLPGIVPPAWSNDRNGHFNWCMAVPEKFSNSEQGKRQAYLDKNIPKKKGGTQFITGTVIGTVTALPMVVGAVAGDTSYLGCFKDSNKRDLSGYVFSSSKMTKKLCVDTCRQKGFKYAGTQYSQQCFCGNSYGQLGKSDNCNMPCSGNKNEICGGSWANSVYRVGAGGNSTVALADMTAGTIGTSSTVAVLIKKLQSQKNQAVDFNLMRSVLEKRADLASKNKPVLSPYESPMFDFVVGDNVSQAVEIGRGYDSLLGYPKLPALKEIPPSAMKELWAFNSHSASHYVKNSEEYYDSLGLSVDVSGSYMGFSASSSTQYEESSHNSKYTETYAAYADIETYLKYPTMTELKLNDQALAVLKNRGVAEFYRQYGDSFVYAIQYGAGFKGTISYDMFQKEEQYKFATTASAGGWGVKAKVGYERASKSKMEGVQQDCLLHNYGSVVSTPNNVNELRKLSHNFQQLANDFSRHSTNQTPYGGVVRYTLIKYSNLPEFMQAAGGSGKLNLDSAKKLLAQLTFYKRKTKRMQNNLLYVTDHNNNAKFSDRDKSAAKKLLTSTIKPQLQSIDNDIAQLQRNPFDQNLWYRLSHNIDNYKKVSGYAPSSEFVEVVVDFPHEYRDKSPNQTPWNAQVGPLIGWPHVGGDSQIASSGKIDVNINSVLEITPDKRKIYLHQHLRIRENKPDWTTIDGSKRLNVYTAPDGYRIVGLRKSHADYYHLRNLRGDGYIPVADVLDSANGAPPAKADDLWEELHVIFDNAGDVDQKYVGLYGKLRMFVELEELAPKE